jgi:Tol biopolymer transport system component
VSVDSTGAQANNDNRNPTISLNGRRVAFTSFADNLAPDDTNGRCDVYLHDRQTGKTTRVSVAPTGSQGNHDSDEASLSRDGGYVAFSTKAKDLLPNDKNRAVDVVIHDCRSRGLFHASVGAAKP